MFSNLSVPDFFLHSSLLVHSMLLIPFSLVPIVTFCILEFRGLLFLLLTGGHHTKIFRGSLSSAILRA